jgi:hypothetical protein
MVRFNSIRSRFEFNWKSALLAAMMAGAVFMIMEMMLVAVAGGDSPWAPPRMIAAMVIGEEVLPPPATFDFGVMMTALVVHFALSVVYGLIFAWIASLLPMNRGIAILAGAAFGLALYLINFYPIARHCFLGSRWRETGSAS